MPLNSSVMRQSISNFKLHCCSKKIQMLRKKVKLHLEQLQVCIFAKIVFGVRCTLINVVLLSEKNSESFFLTVDTLQRGRVRALSLLCWVCSHLH